MAKIEELFFELNNMKRSFNDMGSGVKSEFNNYVSTNVLEQTLNKYTKLKDY